MQKRSYSFFNSYFHIPFLLWVVVGGVMLKVYDTQTLFAFFNGHHTSFLDKLMYGLTFLGDGAVAALVLLALLGISSFRNWWYFLTALLTNILPIIPVRIIKNAVDAPRPLKFFNHAEWIHTLPSWPTHLEHSFPSGHTASAFCLFSFLTLLLSEKYRAFGLAFFLLALLVGFSRMYLAVHFFADVYVGSIIATIFTTAIFAFMNRYRERLQRNSVR